jgi:hypothetical protein
VKVKRFIIRILQSVVSSLRRFPVVLAFCLVAAVMAICLVHRPDWLSNEVEKNLMRALAVTILGAVTAFAINMIFERIKLNSWIRHIVAGIISTVFVIVYYILWLTDINMTFQFIRLQFIICAIFITGIIAHYFPGRQGIGLYTTRVLVRALTTGLYSAVIYAGISAVLFAIDKLLEIHVDSKLYADFGIVTGLLFAPAFFLAGYPNYDRENRYEDMPALLRILLFYIIMPLCAVYATILYIYFFKVLITWEWPSGLVAHLVIWFSAIVLMVLYFTRPVSEGKKWPHLFNLFAPFLMLPLIAMMFVSLGIRINAYGITVNRYIVLAGGIWTVICMLYRCGTTLFKKLPKDIFMPVTLAAVLVLSVAGPWSAFSLSFVSQKSRLDSILEKNKILYNGSIHKVSPDKVTDEDAREVTSIISYLERYDMIKNISYFPTDFEVSDMESYLGIKPQYSWGSINDLKQRYYSYNNETYTIEVKDYDYVLYGARYISDSEEDDVLKKEGMLARNENNRVNIYKDGEILCSVDLVKAMQKFYDLYGDKALLDKKGRVNGELIWEESFEKADVKMVFRYISGYVDLSGDKPGKAISEGISGEYIVLLRLKQK